MAMSKVLVNFVQDRSGSMQSVWAETLSGFRKFIEDLRVSAARDGVDYLFSLTIFDTLQLIIYIDIDISDIEYTAKDSHFYGRPQETSGSPSRLAHHAESLAVDVPLSPSSTT